MTLRSEAKLFLSLLATLMLVLGAGCTFVGDDSDDEGGEPIGGNGGNNGGDNNGGNGGDNNGDNGGDNNGGGNNCTPSCGDRECGDDGCGGDCGRCPMAAPICADGICARDEPDPGCTPQCAGANCGPDSCGSFCGTCGDDERCNPTGRCERVGGGGGGCDAGCGDGFYCDLGSDTCVPGCISDDACGRGEYCDTASRSCREGCNEDSDCPVEQVCQRNSCVEDGEGLDPGEGELDDEDFVVSQLFVDESGQGLAGLLADPLIGNFIGDPNVVLEEEILSGRMRLLLDFSGVDDWETDALIGLEFLEGAHLNGDPSDDFEGATLGLACETQVGENRFRDASLRRGDLTATGGRFPVAGLLPGVSGVTITLRDVTVDGIVEDFLCEGVVSGALPVQELADAAGPLGLPTDFVLPLLQGRADIDLDRDGEPDAISSAFGFSSVRATIDFDARVCRE